MPPSTTTVSLEERRTQKGLETTERILDVAEEVFADKGYPGATLREVADRVDLRIPSLYNHFESKKALYAAVLERGIAPILAALAEFAAEVSDHSHDPGPLLERLMGLLAERPNIPRLVMHETLAGGEHLQPVLARWLGPALDAAQKMVASGPASRRFEADQLPHLAVALYHVAVGYFAIAPLYRELNGIDLLSDEAVQRQTRFLHQMVLILFRNPEIPPTSPRDGE